MIATYINIFCCTPETDTTLLVIYIYKHFQDPGASFILFPTPSSSFPISSTSTKVACMHAQFCHHRLVLDQHTFYNWHTSNKRQVQNCKQNHTWLLSTLEGFWRISGVCVEDIKLNRKILHIGKVLYLCFLKSYVRKPK